MIRSMIISMAALILTGGVTSANDLTLRTSIIVEDKYITLGDLFGLQGEKGATRIAHAPAPGKRSTFDANWLYRVARAHKIRWRPLSRKTKVVAERASQQVLYDDLKTAILTGLKEKGVGDNIELSMSGRTRTIHLPIDVDPTIGVDRLNYDPKSGRFVATVAAPADDPAARRHRISGRVHLMIPIPSVNIRLRPGDIIKKQHVKWVRVRESVIRRDTILHEGDLVGMASKRIVQEFTPIRFSHVRRPVLVKKNGLVTIHLASNLMTLTVQGRALQNGSKGEVVQVKNVQSKKVIEAIVTQAGKVTVPTPVSLAMN